jgi:hypothetical protein
MTGGFEAAGDIATGASMGRAIEPRAGEHVSGADGHGICLNCGTALIGEFCHACGQNGHVHKTLRSIGHDLLHGVFHFEGKIWRTLPMLVLHPGALTRRYIAGERARFVSPLALFLFFVFLMFAVIHAFAGDGSDMALQRHRHDAVAKIDGQITEAKTQLDAAEATGTAGTAKIKDLQDDVTALEATRATVAKAVAVGTVDSGPVDVNVVGANLHTGWAPLDRGIVKANADPSLAIYKLQSSAYKYSWALIPISVPFVALLFLWRRKYKLYDHTIFVIYSLDFMTLLVTLLTIAGVIGISSSLIALAGIFAPPIHIYKQLRGAYELRRLSALWRTCALVIFAFIALSLFLMLLLGLGLME